jgi:hypothetical protein
VSIGLMRQAGSGEVFGGYDENLHRFLRGLPMSASHAVVKCHSLDATGIGLAQLSAVKVIYTWRDLADVTASFMTMFDVDFDRAFAVMSSSLDLYQRHRRNGALIIGYGDIMRDPEGSVRRVAAHLLLDVSDELIAAIVHSNSFTKMCEKVKAIASLDYGPNLIRHERGSYDPETLLNVDHIRNGGFGYGARMLNLGQLRQIDALLAEKGPLE